MNSLASVIIVTYNHKNYLEPCINSVLKQDYPHEIIVVDNCSQDGSNRLVKERFPNIKLIKNTKNVGYGAGNNLGVKHAIGKYVVILNPDTIVEKGWLKELVKPLEKNDGLITTSKILLYDGSIINTCGNINHFTGLGFTRGLHKKTEEYNKPKFVNGISGCSFSIKKSDFKQLGGFDEIFFMYCEDTDFSWRTLFKGFRILYVSTSIVRHDYTLKVVPTKIYHLEKNRYIMLRKYFSKKDFFLLSPSFIITELLVFGYIFRSDWGGIKFKIKAILDGLNIKVNKENGNKSGLFQSLNITIPIEQLSFTRTDRKIKKIANKIFKWNFKVIR